ncbi:CrcB family protein [Rossellomorea sp. AcN35-11]|nr:CrcB family protein [Rossellomorea aquimaris]WJV28458.1 CrcB family protein [Rossellomorea sp. AcN35-11]
MGVNLILIAFGGSLGAIGRFLMANAIKNWSRSSFPKATLFINALGSMLLGLLIGNGSGEDAMFFLGVGFCGSFTTFSTFNWETLKLLQDNLKWGLIYFFGSYIIGLGFGVAGYMIGLVFK